MEPSPTGIRRWWRAPRRLIDREEERRVSFLELFYDLVYVVVISEIGHFLAAHVGPAGVFEAALLFILVWVAWLNGSMYVDLHGQNDLRTRVFTFAQMFAVAGMAVFAHNAFGAGAAGFVIAYVGYLILVGFLWWRTGVHDPDHRPLSQPYVLSMALACLIFAGSLLAPEGWLAELWGVGLLALVFAPLTLTLRLPTNPRVLAQMERSTQASPSLVERFGLLTIIVLGEVIVAVVRGLAGQEQIGWVAFIAAGLGMLLAIGLWWVYFGIIAQRFPQRSRNVYMAWLYLHIPLTAGIVATGAATLNVVEHAGEPLSAGVRWLLVGAIALTLACVALLIPTITVPASHQPYYNRGVQILLGAAAAALLLGLIGLPALALLAILVGLVLLPVLYEINIWVKVFGASEMPMTISD